MSESKSAIRNRRADLILGTLTAAVFIGVAMYSTLEKALAFSVLFGVFSAIVQSKWESRHDIRFWLIISSFATAHIVLISLIHIPKVQFGLISLPFALVDGFAMWGLINWIERRFPVARNTGLGE